MTLTMPIDVKPRHPALTSTQIERMASAFDHADLAAALTLG